MSTSYPFIRVSTLRGVVHVDYLSKKENTAWRLLDQKGLLVPIASKSNSDLSRPAVETYVMHKLEPSTSQERRHMKPKRPVIYTLIVFLHHPLSSFIILSITSIPQERRRMKPKRPVI